ncbi:MAG: NnrU family protein [SAR324 cluster bacterium]|nr:NnrU family protein [SAR324 cluster bacterium]
MLLLILGIAVFVAIHLIPAKPSLRNQWIEQWGEKKYRALFALASFVGLILIIVGKSNASFIPLWNPPVWGRHLAMTLMPLAFYLLAAAHMPSNIKRITRHPMLWGVTLWAAVHLSANGDLASLILFGGFGIYSLFGMWSANQRGSSKSNESLPMSKDGKIAGMALLVYGVFLFLHPYLFGVSVMSTG